MYQIVDDNDDFIVVNKSSGVCVHSDPKHTGLLVRIKNDLQLPQLFPVHRLDKVTSGLLLCAKTQAAASELSQLFERRAIEKYYLALSDKKPKKKQGLIRGDMATSRRGAWKLCSTHNNPAVTQFFSYAINDKQSIKACHLPNAGQRLFLLRPATGKTHQLRVALKSIGSPIVGDRLYGHPLSLSFDTGEQGAPGIYLHAFVLRFMFQRKEFEYVSVPTHWRQCQSEESIFPLLSELGISSPWLLSWPKIKPFVLPPE